ncbi:mechanosensitive ion channel [Sulfurimonas sp. HSL-3221]|uniref:mechanosensitive ion channel domain-containing protein n=1 Tax=Thiomicrolovo sulfuroxydans TaxID=2894755 RepID=UPI001E290203|nr:mechanosensitive ion channel domain-containing protein [Sulfurimonas sp. HSL-3221]UFS63719.1 mechanosensitive ion channel [Sulfurimonas sp. HSL-3221]
MIGRLAGSLLCTAALLFTGPLAVTAAGAETPASAGITLQKPLSWSSVVDTYAHRHILQERLAQIEVALQNAKASGKADTVRRLERDRQRLEAELGRINTAAVAAVEYYVHPTGEELSIRTDMYRGYEAKAAELEPLKSELQQKQQSLNKLLGTARDSAEVQQSLKAATFALETISRIQQRIVHLSDARLTRVNELRKQEADLKDELDKSNIWQKSYTAYLTYLDVKKDLAALQEQINAIDRSDDSEASMEQRDSLLAKQKIMSDQLSLLQSHSASPFADLLKPEEIDKAPEISNPIDIFAGVSYNKKVREQLSEYIKRGDELKRYLRLLLDERQLLASLADVDSEDEYAKKIAELDSMTDKYQTAYTTLQDTADVYAKRVEEIELKNNKAIEEQLFKLANIGGIILFLLIIFFIMKQIAKKYISDNERFYMANKVITFANVSLILLVLLFNYIENVSYVVTVLGFASAGIAIAMKDWFMSMLGWLVIVFGGSIHVGDRVRVDKDGKQYVGDVLDISLLRITILEDITLTTYMHNRRAGRVIFIPNNYIFTEMIANYTHVSLKTVWDGIDITITFDSNHKKAQLIAKEITRKFAKGYTDITRNQLNKLRSRYNLKNTNVEPRIYAFAEENGVRISAWYLTNAYATLTLRSTISMEILDAYGQEDDITIAYPTQRLRLQNEPLPQPRSLPEEGEPV